MRPLSLRLSFLLLLLTTLGRAERLPVKVYTTADGLARDTVLRIVPDSRGFLWFCTNEGLSRFDGYGFVNFNQGLPGRAVSAIVELKDGLYLVATNQGLCWFNAKESRGASQPVFLVDAQLGAAKGLNITDLVVSRSGAVWCSSSTNLFRIERIGDKWVSSEVDLSVIQAHSRLYELRSLLEDRRGALWMVTTSGLYRRSHEGKIDRFGLAEGIPENTLSYAALLEDAEGHIWVGTDRGLYRLLDDPVINRNAVARIYTTRDGLGSNHIAALLQTPDGNLWIATGGGLSQSIVSANSTDLERLRFRNFTQANGVPGVGRMTTDHNGNLWMGAESVGAIKIALHGFTNFDQTDGLARSRIASLLMARDGSLCAMTVDSEQNRAFINRLKGDRYEPIELRRPPGVDHWGWGWYQIMFQSHLSEWWMLTGKGIVRYPSLASMNALASARPQAFYTGNDTVGEQPFRAFEDSRGDVWIGAFTQGLGTLSRWESKTGTFHQYGPSEGISQRSVPSAFGEDNAGNVWVGFYEGGVARYGSGGFKVFEPESGFPSGLVRAVFLDRANRIWIATGEGGAVRIDDPAGHPDRFVTYNTTNGLSSNQATCFTEDKWGRIYIGTGRGVDRLEVATGKLRHYSTADGLANNFPQVALQDRDGALWFGTLQGLSRLIPQSEPPGLPPPIMISELRVGGAPHPVSAVGEIDISDLVLEPDRNQILVGFLGLSFGLGELLRYQYKLEGASTEWSAPGAQRVVNFANLAPGAYRFLVRAVNADGVVSAVPASVSLRVLPPVWRRWWFLTIAAIAFAAPLLAFITYRQRRMRELDSALRESRSLADKLLEQRRDLHNANEILKLEATITRVLGESSTPREASPRLLRAICETTGWQLGAIWELDRASGALQCTDTWHPRETRALAFEAASRSRTFGPGVGLPGRVLASGQPVWISDLSHDDNFPRLTAAAKDGWRSGFGFPILLGSEVIGVLEFFSLEVREPDAEQIKMMSSIGSHLGQLIERKRAEEARHETETRFRTVAETASDAIMTIDESGHIIFVNQSCEQVFGHKTEEMIGRELTMLMPEYLRHLHEAGFARYKETGQRHLNWNSLELPGLHRDGHEIPLEISFGEFLHQGRRYFTGIARDVSERKRADEALRRSREERLEELERVRRRIATDLHDDIGSSLTQISILGEVLRQRLGQEDAGTNDLLTMIAGESREMVDSMSDIVWAINPQKDHLSDLTQRMRRFAVDAYTARNIRLDLQLPAAEDENIKMGANLRREVFLIFKESINNTIKHAGCTETKIDMQIADQILLLTLRDNGCGFDTTQQSDGHGLLSLRERAQGIGGDIEIDSAPGRGTTIVLRVPIAT